MKEKTPCPRCESEQAFPLLHEECPDIQGVLKTYIRCTTCRWYVFIGYTTSEIEDARTRVAQVAARAANEEKRHNSVSMKTQERLDRWRETRNRLVAGLHTRLQEHGIKDDDARTATAH